MDNVLSARALMGISLGFHIIYATIGIGLPFMLMIAEGVSLRTGDELYHQLARSWIRPAGVLFAIGAVSGTILSFELGFCGPASWRSAGPSSGFPSLWRGLLSLPRRSSSPFASMANNGSPAGCCFSEPSSSLLPQPPRRYSSSAPMPGWIVARLKPEMQAIQNKELQAIAEEVQLKLKKVIEQL